MDINVGEKNLTDDELIALVASLAVDSKNLHAAQRITDEQMKRTDEKLECIGVTLGNLTHYNKKDITINSPCRDEGFLLFMR